MKFSIILTLLPAVLAVGLEAQAPDFSCLEKDILPYLGTLAKAEASKKGAVQTEIDCVLGALAGTAFSAKCDESGDLLPSICKALKGLDSSTKEALKECKIKPKASGCLFKLVAEICN